MKRIWKEFKKNLKRIEEIRRQLKTNDAKNWWKDDDERKIWMSTKNFFDANPLLYFFFISSFFLFFSNFYFKFLLFFEFLCTSTFSLRSFFEFLTQNQIKNEEKQKCCWFSYHSIIFKFVIKNKRGALLLKNIDTFT